jgi:tetratricopeptide (TPR) repeat protein
VPAAYAVADGYLVQLSRPIERVIGGALRLRRLADHLYLPADADLVPALLPEEAADMGRRRGLVFLPGGRVLEFDPAKPVPIAGLMGARELRRDAWQPLPEPEPLADRLTEITLQQPDIPPDDLLAPGGEGIGTEDPRPEDAGTPRRALGKTMIGMGKIAAWLGTKLGLKGLGALGKRWMEAGIHMAPRLAESLLGKQEASLRDLLDAFRRGDIEKALRRALPLGGDERGAMPTTGARLPFHNLLYSLNNLLGAAGGRAGVWLTRDNVFHELEREYRKQAELAAQRGDYRRAAFIYGKLLRDFRSAAAVLAKGGLHRDAAIIYLKRLDDPLAAAREFEAAGEIDRALAIYRRRGAHVLAGDLLRRAGEEEQAIAEYQIEAANMVKAGHGHYQAGELLRDHAHRADLALPYYEKGWSLRPADNPIPCAIRLGDSYVEDAALEKLLVLTDEAGAFLEPPGNDSVAADFYNHLATLANRVASQDLRDDLRDRSLMGIAGKLRQRTESGTASPDLVSPMLGAMPIWSPAQVSDAQYALRRASKQPRETAPPAPDYMQIAIAAQVQKVTAVCQAAESGDLFLGFESGEIVCFRPRSSEVVTVTNVRGPVLGLSATGKGDAVLVLTHWREHFAIKSLINKGLVRRMSYEMAGMNTLSDEEAPALGSGLWGDAQRFRGSVLSQSGAQFFDGPLLLSSDRLGMRHVSACHFCATGDSSPGFVLMWGAEFTYFAGSPSAGQYTTKGSTDGSGWNPKARKGLSHPLLSWLDVPPEHIQVAGIVEVGTLYVSDIRNGPTAQLNVLTKAWSEHPVLAAALVREDIVAALTTKALCWLRFTPGGLVLLKRAHIRLTSAVACFGNPHGKEVLVVCADGTIVRVPEPGKGA